MTDDDSRKETPMDAVPGPGFEQNDAHADIDPEVALADLSVVVASNRERNYTAESVPDYVETIVRTDKGRNRARNRGVEAASGEWIVVADDDITFPTTLTSILLDGMTKRHVVGVEDFWPMEWVLTRYVIFHRSLWKDVGGFDESREHGGDTDFALKCEKAGARVHGIPRAVVPHHDVDTEFTEGAHREWLFYLLKKHPLKIAPKAVLLGLARLGVIEAKNV